jgi:hypothetical protein
MFELHSILPGDMQLHPVVLPYPPRAPGPFSQLLGQNLQMILNNTIIHNCSPRGDSTGLPRSPVLLQRSSSTKSHGKTAAGGLDEEGAHCELLHALDPVMRARSARDRLVEAEEWRCSTSLLAFDGSSDSNCRGQALHPFPPPPRNKEKWLCGRAGGGPGIGECRFRPHAVHMLSVACTHRDARRRGGGENQGLDWEGA